MSHDDLDDVNGQPRALVVDADEAIRLTLEAALSELGFETAIATTGDEAFTLLESEAFRLMLLDISIANPDGMAVLRWARENRPFMAAIVITAHGTALNAVEAVQIGAADFIPKPITPEEVHRHIARVLSHDENDLGTADYDAGAGMDPRLTRINDRQFDAAAAYVYDAIRRDDSRPEPFDLLGVLYRLRGNYEEARRYFEKALSLDFGYAPALRNLHELPNGGSGGNEPDGSNTGD